MFFTWNFKVDRNKNNFQKDENMIMPDIKEYLNLFPMFYSLSAGFSCVDITGLEPAGPVTVYTASCCRVGYVQFLKWVSQFLISCFRIVS